MEDVRTSIYVAIRTAPMHIRRGLTAKRPHQGDKATADMTDHILKALGHYEIHRTAHSGAPDASALMGHQPGRER